jgi:hypothetical protein
MDNSLKYLRLQLNYKKQNLKSKKIVRTDHMFQFKH